MKIKKVSSKNRYFAATVIFIASMTFGHTAVASMIVCDPTDSASRPYTRYSFIVGAGMIGTILALDFESKLESRFSRGKLATVIPGCENAIVQKTDDFKIIHITCPNGISANLKMAQQKRINFVGSIHTSNRQIDLICF